MEIHETTRRLYKKKKPQIFLRIMQVILFIGIVYLGMGLYYLEFWNTQQLNSSECINTHIATINGVESRICVHSDGSKTSRVAYKYCSEVATIRGMVEHCDREIISISWK